MRGQVPAELALAPGGRPGEPEVMSVPDTEAASVRALLFIHGETAAVCWSWIFCSSLRMSL